jgi:hypothetical protein
MRSDTHRRHKSEKDSFMMIVYVYPQSLVYGIIEPSWTLRVSHPLHEIIMRGLLLQVMPLKDTPTKRKKEK